MQVFQLFIGGYSGTKRDVVELIGKHGEWNLKLKAGRYLPTVICYYSINLQLNNYERGGRKVKLFHRQGPLLPPWYLPHFQEGVGRLVGRRTGNLKYLTCCVTVFWFYIDYNYYIILFYSSHHTLRCPSDFYSCTSFGIIDIFRRWHGFLFTFWILEVF